MGPIERERRRPERIGGEPLLRVRLLEGLRPGRVTKQRGEQTERQLPVLGRPPLGLLAEEAALELRVGLDAVERAIPSLTPQLFVDPRPAMRRTA